jgi:hypothetical protein
MTKQLFKIRNKETGLFTEGGSSAFHHYSIHGKTWTSHKNVKSFLSYFKTAIGPKKKLPKNWEIVVFELKELNTIPIEAFEDQS